MLHVAERKRFYRFFAALFAYPDQQLLAELAGATPAAMATALRELEPPPELSADNLLTELQTAFTGLFINRLGGAPAPPYGSVYLEEDGRLLGPSTRQVAEFYRAAGLALEGSVEPADYLATELEFLYFLVDQEEQAFGRRDLAAARSATGRQVEFFRQYLHPWVGEFCRRIEQEGGAHPLYRWGGRALARFCAVEAAWLEKLG
jgi:putative dimethyl sulfoxide reductase chaperone